MTTSTPLSQDEISQTAETLAAARFSGGLLEAFPGRVPPTLNEAYQIQDLVIGAAPESIVGWKIGMVPPELREQYGAERIIGPVFKNVSHFIGHAHSDDEKIVLPVFAGGFIAVEAEIIIEIAEDIEPGSVDTSQGVEHLVKAMYAGVEIASSPVPDLNSYGPAAIISDIGNQHGMVIGPAIENWQTVLAETTVETIINGELINSAPANGIHNGQLGALAFFIDCCAKRGIKVPAGSMILTGATTGVHETLVGSTSTVKYGALGNINMDLVAIK
ncbi:hypothetical protein IC617_07205 [Neiella sp. HB171785]|uniref:2-keto-4-pentenoate hydratase n=1 Tax=Neiella litorisoli TaxID=2771431 RepID=A0A8J6UIV4_9GAMM|nr:hypothetical protein [Neiella litorisoli]MBD1389208.1 hypothetical protein [Neiella litorisoli]